MKQLKRDVHLVLSPKAAKLLDRAIGEWFYSRDSQPLPEDEKILVDIRKQIREFATDPK